MSGKSRDKRRPAKKVAPRSGGGGALRDRIAVLEREAAEAREREAASNDILRLIAGSPTDLAVVLDGIVASAVRIVGAEWGVLARFDGERLHLVTQRGIAPEFLEMAARVYPIAPHPDAPSFRAMAEGAPVYVEDALKATFAGTRNLAEATVRSARPFRSLLSLPLLREGRGIGTINLAWSEIRPYPADCIDALRAFADQAVIAIENVRLFTELETRNRDLSEALEQQTATADILRVISGSPTDVQPVFDAIARHAVTLCGGLGSIVVRYDGALMHLAASHRMGPLTERATGMFPRPPGRDLPLGVAILDRRIIHIRDLQGSPEFTGAIAHGLDRRSVIAVPLQREHEVVGAIGVGREDAGGFTDRQVALLQTFADQAVIAIENARVFAELEARNRDLTVALDQQTATAGILRAISQAQTDVEPVFEAIADSLMRLLGTWSALVFRYDGERLRVVAARGGAPGSSEAILERFQRRGPVRPDEGTLAGLVVQTRAVQQVEDTETEARFPSLREGARERGFRSTVQVPMLLGDEVVGIVAVTRREPGAYAPSEIALLRTFADQAVIAIENARLLVELEGRNHDLTEALDRQTATAEILQVISASPTDVQPVFDAIAESAMRLFGAWSVVVWRFEDGALRAGAARGGLPGSSEAMLEQWGTPRLPGEETPLGRTVRSRAIHQVVDVETEALNPQLVILARQRGWRSTVHVPMVRGEDLVGVIAVSRAEPGALPPADIALLQTFADQAVIAVENARLLTELQARTAELQRSVEQLTALGEVGQAVSSSLDLETVLTTIVSRAVALTAVDDGVVFEYDEAAEGFTYRAATETEGALAQARGAAGRIRKGEGVLGRTAVTLEPAQVADIAQVGAYEGRLRETLLDSGVRALLAVPMLREGRLLGGIVLSRNRPGEFPLATVELLRTFATQSALAIQNARLYRELAEQGRQLEVASRHKSEFLASMSHELRTPLNGILGFNEMILGEIYGEVPPDLREPLTEMQASGRHLLRLINNVLDLSKIEAGRMELALSDYAVADVVEQVRASLHPLAADKGLEFVTAVSADLPLVHGDAGRIAQCLTNLAGNALKFTREGRVEIAAEVRDDTLVYRVSDTGIGIPADRIETLFTEFRQADATIASEFGGSGLGLSITRKFAEMHGGRVWVESEPGRGSRFFLAVPVRVSGGAPA